MRVAQSLSLASIGAALVLSSCHGPEVNETTTGISGFEGSDDETTGSGTWMTSTTSTSSASTDNTSGDLPNETTNPEATTSSGPFTTGPDHDLATDGAAGCHGKLDVLLVLSRDSIMAPVQPAVEAAIPTLLETLQTTFADLDLHFLVTNGNYDVWGITGCFEQCDLNDDQGCAPLGPPDYPCDAYTPGVLELCDKEFGAGVTFPAGFGAANQRCLLAGDRRYLKSGDLNFEEAYACVTDLGIIAHSGARPASAMQHAVTLELNNDCNAGFLRDDAMLFVVMIEGGGSNVNTDGPEVWTDALLAAKHGNPDAFVVLAVTTDVAEKVSVCNPDGGSGTPTPIIAFVEGLEHGLWGSVCEDDYTPFITAAADLVVEVCDSFIPM